jgi:hypothetical protein
VRFGGALKFSATGVLAGLIMAGATVSAKADPTLVGIWYSAFQPDEPNVMSMIEFKDDGTFYEEFRKCDAGDLVGYQFEIGTWTFEDGVERTVTNIINGTPAHVEDFYTVERLTDTQRRVRLEPQGYEFEEHRVTKFEFPDCPTGT